MQHSLDVGHLGPHVEQHFVEQFPFKIARLGMLSAYVDRDSRLTAVVRQVFLQHLGGNHARLFDGGYLFGHILQLAYVAPPVVVFEHRPRLCVQRYRGHAVLDGDIGGEFTEQGVDILLAFAQGGNIYRYRVEPVIEVFPEASLLDGRLQVDVGRRHDAYVRLLRLRRTDTDELSRLEYAQQAHLGGVGKFGYLVEKYRTSVGLFEVSLAGLRRTREGAFFMAE